MNFSDFNRNATRSSKFNQHLKLCKFAYSCGNIGCFIKKLIFVTKQCSRSNWLTLCAVRRQEFLLATCQFKLVDASTVSACGGLADFNPMLQSAFISQEFENRHRSLFVP